MLLEKLPSIFDGSVQLIEQDADLATMAPKMNQLESLIDFNTRTATEIYNHWRAFIQWPGTFGVFKVADPVEGKSIRCKILKCRVLTSADGAALANMNGKQVRCVKWVDPQTNEKQDCLVVPCRDGTVLGVWLLTPETRKQMDARSFVNGMKGTSLYV
jgi:methionyl-tRNA formyltransferase